MSGYQGDIQLADTIYWTFTTVSTTGAPTVLTGSPTATAYTDGGITQSATGVTLTADFDGVVGLNLITVVATGGNGFATGETIDIVLDAGTVGGTTVVGYSVGTFSIERNPVNWNRVAGTSTTVDLSATTTSIVDTATAVTAISAGGIGTSSMAANSIATGVIATDAIGVLAMAAGSISAGTIASGELTNIENEIWDGLKSAHVVANSFGDFLDIEVSGRLASADINLTGGAVDTVTTLTNLPAITANWLTAAGLATDAVNEIARAIGIQQNAAFSDIEFLMVLTSDHVTAATGLAPTGERSIDGGAFGAVSGSIAEVSDGIYQFDALAADTNGSVITYRFLAGTADDVFVTIKTVA